MSNVGMKIFHQTVICNNFYINKLIVYALQSYYMQHIQGVSVMLQNINRGNRGTHMEHKSVHKPWPYLNRFQVTANRMKKPTIEQRPLFLK